MSKYGRQKISTYPCTYKGNLIFCQFDKFDNFSVKYETKIMSNTQSLIYSLSMNQFIIMLAKITIFLSNAQIHLMRIAKS